MGRLQVYLSVLFVLGAATTLGAAVQEDGERVQAVVVEFDRLAASDLWPGFDPASTPLAIYDGTATWLFRHPDPPEPFRRYTLESDIWFMPGRHSDVIANTQVEIAGVRTATLMMDSSGARTASELGAVLIHESFHAYQAALHPDWFPNEAELFLYPFVDGDLLALRRLETEALRRSLLGGEREAACWAETALELRDERFERLSEGSVSYERHAELAEGLANYVQLSAAEVPAAEVVPSRGFAANGVRERAYASGTALAINLDRLSPEWKSEMEAETRALDELLGDALLERAAPVCEFSASERREVENRAYGDADVLIEEREAAKAAFLSKRGWRLVIASQGDPLWPQGFDPSNVLLLGGSEVLHTRWLKAGNSSGTVEVLDLEALTEATGAHPLFNGIATITIAGIAEEPAVIVADDVVEVSAPGVTARFNGAQLEREGKTIRVVLVSDS